LHSSYYSMVLRAVGALLLVATKPMFMLMYDILEYTQHHTKLFLG
jgi:hypothetical protein